jgi:hypothetical protein
MAQARGSASQVLIDFETTYGVDPVSPVGISVPYHFPVDLKGSRPLKPSTVHRPSRNPATPFYGNRDVKGGMSVPVDVIAFGYWLRALLGAPTTAPPTSDTLNNAAAVDKVGDYVGLPITGHAFIAGQPVTITGTDHYDGTHIIYSKTANEIVIPAVYAAETFAGTETVVSGLYTHIFKPAAAIPSLVMDVGFTNIAQYFKFNGVKLAKLAMDYGGDKELMAKLDFMGAIETPGTSAYDATPTILTLTKFQNRQLSFKEGGSALALIKSGSLEIANDLDGDSYLANGDTRFDLPEGDVTASGALQLFFQDRTLYDLAAAGTERSFEIILTSGVYSLSLLFPELLYTVETPTVVKGGVYADFKFEGFYDNGAGEAAFIATLVNNHAAYA